MRLTLRASAKINLDLRIGARRPDGYHELHTVYQTLDLHDTVIVESARGAFALDGDPSSMPLDQTNLVWRAAQALWRASGKAGDPRGASVRVAKRIPARAGLGGGSSDAAAALVGLSRVWRVPATLATLNPIAATLGADVSFFLMGGTALGLGRGEQLYPLVNLPRRYVVLVLPDFGVSTLDAYRWLVEDRGSTAGPRPLDPGPRTPDPGPRPPVPGRRTPAPGPRPLAPGPRPLAPGPWTPDPGPRTPDPGPRTPDPGPRTPDPGPRTPDPGPRTPDPGPWTPDPGPRTPDPGPWTPDPGLWTPDPGPWTLHPVSCRNDLEASVERRHPAIRSIRQQLAAAGAELARMSGSGSAVFGMFSSQSAARRAAAGLVRAGHQVVFTCTRPRNLVESRRLV